MVTYLMFGIIPTGHGCGHGVPIVFCDQPKTGKLSIPCDDCGS